MTENRNYIGNGSTIVKYLCFLIAGRIVALSVAHGIQLPVDTYELAEFLGYILGFVGATIDARYKNNLKWNYLKKLINTTIKTSQTSDETGDDDDI